MVVSGKTFVRAFVRRFLPLATLLSGFAVVFLCCVYLWVSSQGRGYIRDRIEVGYDVAIVFGAGLSRNGTPSPVLTDRVTAAVNLYKNAKVTKLLMSGDNRFVNYNEPEAMRQLALSLGVPDDDIVLDYAGRRTYDTCYRAHEIFGLDRAVLVTNEFHLPRALFTCRTLGVDVVGYSSDTREYNAEIAWEVREIPATIVAWWQSVVTRPKPILGTRIPIVLSK